MCLVKITTFKWRQHLLHNYARSIEVSFYWLWCDNVKEQNNLDGTEGLQPSSCEQQVPIDRSLIISTKRSGVFVCNNMMDNEAMANTVGQGKQPTGTPTAQAKTQEGTSRRGPPGGEPKTQRTELSQETCCKQIQVNVIIKTRLQVKGQLVINVSSNSSCQVF